MNITRAGRGTVTLLSKGDRIYTDIAARFCKSERSAMEIVESEYSPELVRKIIESGHLAATEFDTFVFAVEGFSRVCETQLVRKRIGASFLIKTGRADKGGKRSFDMVLPKSVEGLSCTYGGYLYGAHDILKIIERWYETGASMGIPEEDLRFMKPQATEFKGIIGMNARSLRDFFKVRCCRNAQHEIRSMANQMLGQVRKVAPDLFRDAGASCVALGYCPENELQHPACAPSVLTHKEVLKMIEDSTLWVAASRGNN
jgi:thymidylate synthase (FAD)